MIPVIRIQGWPSTYPARRPFLGTGVPTQGHNSNYICGICAHGLLWDVIVDGWMDGLAVRRRYELGWYQLSSYWIGGC